MLSRVWVIGIAVAGTVLTMSTTRAEPQRGGYGGRDRIECSSNDYRFTRCDVDWRSADLVRQLSESRCIEGRTWGVDRRGLWVDRGCAGVFVERGGRHGGHHDGWRPGPNWDRDIRLTCSSDDYRYRMCQVDVGRGGDVRIVRQLSNSACIEGRSWGYNRAGIWVSGGCSAIFEVERRWR